MMNSCEKCVTMMSQCYNRPTSHKVKRTFFLCNGDKYICKLSKALWMSGTE